MRPEVTTIPCSYCRGERSPRCMCETDCGARPDGIYNIHWCPRSDGYGDYLRGTGLYSEEEIVRAVAKSRGERP